MLFIKLFLVELFSMFSPVLISISHENAIETSLASEKCYLAKFCDVDAWSQSLLFTGETSFSSRLLFNIPETSTQIQKSTKYQSTDVLIFRSSRSQMFFKISVLKNFATFTGKHLCWPSFSRQQILFFQLNPVYIADSCTSFCSEFL